MMVEASVVASLEVLLKREIQLHAEYIKLLKEERSILTKFNSAKLSALTEKRDLLAGSMQEAQVKRIGLMKQFPDWRGFRLTDLVQHFCSPVDQARLLPLIVRLREAAKETQRQSGEFASVLDFASRMVGGIASLFWSGSQHKNTSYGRKGLVKETLQPDGNRLSNVLKQA